MIFTTLDKIKKFQPTPEVWKKLLSSLNKSEADDEPLDIQTIFFALGLDETAWCLCTLPQYNKQYRLFAIHCVKLVEHLIPDVSIHQILDIAEQYARGASTEEIRKKYKLRMWDYVIKYPHNQVVKAVHSTLDQEGSEALYSTLYYLKQIMSHGVLATEFLTMLDSLEDQI